MIDGTRNDFSKTHVKIVAGHPYYDFVLSYMSDQISAADKSGMMFDSWSDVEGFLRTLGIYHFDNGVTWIPEQIMSLIILSTDRYAL